VKKEIVPIWGRVEWAITVRDGGWLCEWMDGDGCANGWMGVSTPME